MYLGPVVAGTGLAEDKVVGAEELAEGAGTDGVHGTGLQVHQDGTGHIAAARGLVEVHVDALQLQVRVTVVRARGVHTVLVGDDLWEVQRRKKKRKVSGKKISQAINREAHLPELGANLVAALASLNVNNLSHLGK